MATKDESAPETVLGETHLVENQPPPLEGVNLYTSNTPLHEAVMREGAGWAQDHATQLGEFVGGVPLQSWGRLANENPPVLHTHDRYGHRIDEVEYHPAWHQLMRMGVTNELHSLPWTSREKRAHTARAALYMTAIQAETGFACPITMTFAVTPALRAQPELAEEWEPLITATTYDPRLIPASEKGSAIAGMALTEKQGGSDVRANTTVAVPISAAGAGCEYLLTGHKWFCSAPMSDVFLVLAQTPEGLSCFLLPRVLPDGTRNAFQILRLKDKLGDRSNASGEIELRNAYSRMVGQPGRGVATIIEMVGHTRLDCMFGATAGMRMAVVQALHHTSHRRAFGKLLIEQPLMRNVLADLCLESEAATALAMRLARAYDDAAEAEGSGQDGSDAQLFKRLATAIGKYWTCKRAAGHAVEALECLGGNGYVEESEMPRLYRGAPLNSLWEGSGNVIALDVLRAIRKTPRALEVFFAEVDKAQGGNARLDSYVQKLKGQFANPATLEGRARRVVEGMALGLQGSLLVRNAPAAVSDAFCASRLARDGYFEYGTLPASSDFETIIARSLPNIS